jgi:hypothetical protein
MNTLQAVQSKTYTVFGRNLQRKPVRGVNFREECHWSHACSLQHAWDPMATSSVNFCRKTRTVPTRIDDPKQLEKVLLIVWAGWGRWAVVVKLLSLSIFGSQGAAVLWHDLWSTICQEGIPERHAVGLHIWLAFHSTMPLATDRRDS